MMNDIDFVVTYLDNSDKSWQNDYMKYAKIEKRKYDPNGVRFRNWDNFRYVLRSVATYMPFIRNLYIVVSSELQVPNYINRDNVKIVYHKDIIPAKYLPTFNSNTIELFLYRIPDLSENFLYSNDDIFVSNKMNPEEFFDDKMNPKISVKKKE